MKKPFQTVWACPSNVKSGDALKSALVNGANPNHLSWEGHAPILHARDYDQLSLLLAHGANPNARFDRGSTALHLTHHSEHSTELLVKCGAHINAQDDEGNTPLHYANSENQKVLLALGADATVKNNAGQTPYEMRLGRIKQLNNEDFYAFLKMAEKEQSVAKSRKDLWDGIDVPFIGTQSQEQHVIVRRRM